MILPIKFLNHLNQHLHTLTKFILGNQDYYHLNSSKFFIYKQIIKILILTLGKKDLKNKKTLYFILDK